jgi:hypothetical protein
MTCLAGDGYGHSRTRIAPDGTRLRTGDRITWKDPL